MVFTDYDFLNAAKKRFFGWDYAINLKDSGPTDSSSGLKQTELLNFPSELRIPVASYYVAVPQRFRATDFNGDDCFL
jgi:hypothetical protein